MYLIIQNYPCPSASVLNIFSVVHMAESLRPSSVIKLHLPSSLFLLWYNEDVNSRVQFLLNSLNSASSGTVATSGNKSIGWAVTEDKEKVS